jgi:7-cyano-7-deazaguanine tRNA-ribosyltransferase
VSFEVIAKDLAGRIGRLYTKSGAVETPAYSPWWTPKTGNTRGCHKAVLRAGNNEFVLRLQTCRREAGTSEETSRLGRRGHDRLRRVSDTEVRNCRRGPRRDPVYQSHIGSDIGVILDLPFDYEEPYDSAVLKVEETLRRAKRAATLLDSMNMLVVAPIQGALYTDLLVRSTRS